MWTLVAMTELNGVTSPIAPALISPEPAVKVKLKLPSTVATVIVPPPLPELSELRMTFEVRVIGETKEMGALLAKILLPKETAPAPVCENPPSPDSVSPTAAVKRPEFAMVIGPAAVVVTSPSKVIAAAVRLMPPTVFVLRSLL